MPLISLEHAQLAYGHVPLLDHAELKLDKGERVGLLGRNGAGKTSLLKVIVGLVSLDDGKVWRAPSLRIGYVPQEPPLDDAATVFDTVAGGLEALQGLLIEYHDILHRLAEPDQLNWLDLLPLGPQWIADKPLRGIRRLHPRDATRFAPPR